MYQFSHSGLQRQVTFCCCIIDVVLHDTLVLEPQNGLYTLGGRRGQKKCTVCTLENVNIFGWPLTHCEKILGRIYHNPQIQLLRSHLQRSSLSFLSSNENGESYRTLDLRLMLLKNCKLCRIVLPHKNNVNNDIVHFKHFLCFSIIMESLCFWFSVVQLLNLDPMIPNEFKFDTPGEGDILGTFHLLTRVKQ